MHLSPGVQLGRYEILALLGKGGMGEVYRARDTELDRQVAIKVLPMDVADDEARLQRFRREAKAVAKLSHANILEIFDFGRHGEITYTVTELLEGESLREMLSAKSGGLSWKEAREIAVAVADGLGAAHANGVVHRDIKPDNLFLCTDGRVKILDFGLASLREPVSEEDVTVSLEGAVSTPGMVLGTVGYMSPEQVRGEPTDARTDIFALGCVLYEMISGRQPFRRNSSAETLTAILHDDPTSLEGSGVDLEPDVAEVIARCLEKKVDRRFQSARDLAFALRGTSDSSERPRLTRPEGGRRRWLAPAIALVAVIAVGLLAVKLFLAPDGSPTGGPRIRSLAVLPLANLSGDPNQDYFSDGMTEALITSLSRVGALRVISRTSVMRYKDSPLSLPEIADELGVDAVLEGSAQREENRVRVTAQLVDAKTDQHLWADSFEREIRSVLALQSEVAHAIANAVEVELSPGQATRLASSREVDPKTYDAYLRGMHHMHKGTPEGFAKGMAYLQEAVDQDPTDPLAYAGLATGYVTMGHATGQPEDFRRAKAAAQHAIGLDPDSAEAQAALAEAELFRDWNWDAAERAFERAIDLNPNHAEAHAFYASLFMLRGEFERAIAEMSLARDLDPLAPIFTAWVAEIYWGVGHYDDAITEEQKALELNPELTRARAVLGLAYLDKGLVDEALDNLQTASKNLPVWKPMVGTALLAAGRRNEASALLEELTGDPGYAVSPVLLALFQGAYGDLDGAVASLERGYETRNGLMPWIGSWFDWSNLTGDPRYHQILARMNLEYVGRKAPVVPQ